MRGVRVLRRSVRHVAHQAKLRDEASNPARVERAEPDLYRGPTRPNARLAERWEWRAPTVLSSHDDAQEKFGCSGDAEDVHVNGPVDFRKGLELRRARTPHAGRRPLVFRRPWN